MDKMREVLEKEIGNIKPSHDEIKHIHDIVAKFLDLIKAKLKKANADIILGGSFAKDTLIKKNKYDIDFFIRFDYNKYYDNSYEISGILESILNQVIKKISPMPKMEIHLVLGQLVYMLRMMATSASGRCLQVKS